MIGEVLSAIPANQRANTVVVFTSDHGDLAMDRGHTRYKAYFVNNTILNLEHHQYYKMSMYEGSVRVPLIISGPQFEPNATVTSYATLLDIYPTLLRAAYLPQRTQLDGTTLIRRHIVPLPTTRAIICRTRYLRACERVIYVLTAKQS